MAERAGRLRAGPQTARPASNRDGVAATGVAHHSDLDLLTQPQENAVILGLVSGRGEWPWRRDWSQTPNTCKVYAVWAVVTFVLGGLYLVRGNLIGVCWLVLAVAWAVMTLCAAGAGPAFDTSKATTSRTRAAAV